MALRIEAWLGLERGGEARLWLAEQTAYDMWRAEQRIKATPLHVPPAPTTRDLAPACRQSLHQYLPRRSSQERREGEECVSTCRFRWGRDHVKKQEPRTR